MSSAFLSGENTNLVVQQIVTGLNKYGVDIDIKGLQSKIINFMARVEKEYPNQDLGTLNQFVINKCVEKYLNNQPQFNQSSGKSKLDKQLERELMNRGYAQARAPEVPPRPDFSQPIAGAGGYLQQPQRGNGGPNGGMSLNQARGGIDPPDIESIPAPILTNPGPGSNNNLSLNGNGDHDDLNNSSLVVSDYSHSSSNSSSNFRFEKLILSLNRSDLININGNMFTFSWNRKIVSDFKDNFQVKLQYVTIPKQLPYLLVKYQDQVGKLKNVYSATGKNYSAKLIPSHTSDEYTTYLALDHQSTGYENLPHTLTFQLIPPNQTLDLNMIPVQKITKNKSQIHIITKYPHNLSVSDNLILEFPNQYACYKVSNLQILDDKQILVDSPFVGYFTSDFKLLRNDWNIDLTVCCQYHKL